MNKLKKIILTLILFIIPSISHADVIIYDFEDGEILHGDSLQANLDRLDDGIDAVIASLRDSTLAALQDSISSVLEYTSVDSGFVIGYGDYRSMGDSTYRGIPIILLADEAIEFGEVCYVDGDYEYALADADALGTMPGFVICVQRGGVAADEYGLFLETGIVKFTPWTTITVADDSVFVYTGTTAGQPTVVRPSGSGDQVQKLGRVIAVDVFMFKPDYTIVGVE